VFTPVNQVCEQLDSDVPLVITREHPLAVMSKLSLASRAYMAMTEK